MNYKNLEENPAVKAGTVKKREYFMRENRVYINDGYITFNIIELDRNVGKITVNICNQGHHVIDTFELMDLDGCTYFEYGRPIPEKIYIDEFKEIK